VTAVLLSTTTVTISRPDTTAAPYDPQADPTTVAMGIPAHIGQESGRAATDGTTQETVTWRLDCDLADLIHDDIVLDERTGLTYTVVWARPRRGLGLDHTEASLVQVSQRNPVGT
jgi:hypothetical protein